MLTSIQKLILIPAFTLSAGFFISMDEQAPTDFEVPYPGHLVGAFTGGFGEETCRSCHFDYDLNWEEGRLSVDGFPDEIKGGKQYQFEIKVMREDMGRAGFQLSSRFREGSQAGVFHINDNERLMFTKEVPDSLQYMQHSEAGTDPEKNGENSWVVIWEAPDSNADSIYFHISANAANEDQSEFGDWIYAEEIILPVE